MWRVPNGEVPMQVPTPQADARELRSTRRAYRERRRAAPTTDPRVLAPACASQACTCGNGTWESWRLPNGSWNWYGMGIQWCSWWILWDFDLCSQLETTCDRPSCGTPRAQCDRESPAAASLTLCSPLRSPCLLRSFSGAVSNTTSPSSRSTHPCATPQPLSSARPHVRTRLCCAFEPCCAFNQ